MDYEDEFEEDEDAESFNRRYRVDETLPTFADTRLRRPIEDNTLMTMSYKGAQVSFLFTLRTGVSNSNPLKGRMIKIICSVGHILKEIGV